MRYLAIILIFLVPLIGNAQDLPKKSNRLVTDYTNTLSKKETRQLEEKLVAYDRESSVQIAIVIMQTLDAHPISDYAFQLGEKWGIGQANTDNGALILISMEERDMWIATGYGLEATVTDALCKRIIENEMKPRFRNGDFAGGLSSASDAIILASRGEYQGSGGARSDAPPIGIILLVIIFATIFMVIKGVQVSRYSKLNGMSFWAAWALLNATRRRHSGSYGSFTGGSGGFGGGGGFGGFGGGSFGGGGAGGSW